MTPRERVLLIAMFSLFGVGALLLGTFQWFIKPLRESNKQIAAMREKRDDVQLLVLQFQEDQKALELARARSLPANSADAGLEYMTNYLQPLLRDSGLKKAAVTKSPLASDLKFTSTIPGVKAGHKVMTFQVHAEEVELSALIRAMERLQRTPYEHRITSLLINRPEKAGTALDPDPKLKIDLVIETLLVAKTQTKLGLPPGLDPTWIALDHFTARQGEMPLGWGLLLSRLALQLSVPQPENRAYGQIANKNIFAGLIPYKEPPPPPPPPPPPIVKKVEPSIDVPQFVYLVHVETVAGETSAIVRNRLKPAPEPRWIAKPGHDTFKVDDEETRFVFYHAKVLHIDSRAVYFQAKGEIYELMMGMNLADATKRPLSAKRRTELKLTLDAAWTAQENAKDKGNDKTKVSTKKNPFFKGGPKTSK